MLPPSTALWTPPGRSPDTLQENPMRARLLEALTQQPGLTFSDLLRRFDGLHHDVPRLGSGALHWHLQVLRHEGSISTRRGAGNRRFYPARGPWHADLEACALIQAPARWALARALAHADGLTVRELEPGLPTDPRNPGQAVRSQLRRLRAWGFVELHRTGRCVRYHANERLRRAVRALETTMTLTPPHENGPPPGPRPPTGPDLGPGRTFPSAPMTRP